VLNNSYIREGNLMFSIFKTQILYVQIRKDSFTIRCATSGESISLDAQEQFSSKRLLIGEFTPAERLLKHGFTQLSRGLISPIAVMHPLELVDERLSEVENKILRELALSAGAREVKIHLGSELSDQALQLYK
jgi:rod shape-determining protein MreB and related proteins